MKLVLLLGMLLVAVDGCSNTSNPATTSFGTLQYTLSTAHAAYTIEDTLDFSLVVRNVGSVADTVLMGDAILSTWSLKNTSGKLMLSGEDATGNMVALIPIAPGQSKLVREWIHGVTDSSGGFLSPGSYMFEVDYADHLVSIGISVR